MTRRRTALALLALLAVVAASVGAFVLRSGSDRSNRRQPLPSGVTQADIAQARRDGTSACDGYRETVELIEQNSSVDAVMSSLGDAVDRADAAADRDPAWRSLASGLHAVQVALERDDPRAADLGTRVVRSVCEDGDDADTPTGSNAP